MILYLIPLAGLCFLVYLYRSTNVPPPRKDADPFGLRGKKPVPEPPESTAKSVLKGIGAAVAVVGIGFVALVGLVFLVCAGGGR